jgi:hypothetical protein
MKTKGLSNKRKGAFAAILLMLPVMAHFSLHAQVIIGGLTDPSAGALLDLNSTVRGGLVLSNVAIEDLWKIPVNAVGYFPGIIDGSNDEVNPSFTGAVVYHTGQNNIPAGIYVWNGDNWTPAGDDCRELATEIVLVVHGVAICLPVLSRLVITFFCQRSAAGTSTLVCWATGASPATTGAVVLGRATEPGT